MMDVEKIRKDFRIFERKNAPIYFDNACTTFKPIQVIEAMSSYFEDYPACAGRSMHHLGKKADEQFELARHDIAKFVSAGDDEIVFTKNTTEAMNLVANSFELPKDKNEIVTTIMEHHSALLPFRRKSENEGITLTTVNNVASIEEWEEKVTKKTGIVVVHAVNNTIGTAPPLKEIVKIAHDYGALVLVDGAQGVPHSSTNFRDSNFDFLAFSGHKMLGPPGIGCLVAKKGLLAKMRPFIVGGGTIEHVKADSVTYLQGPHKFEGGIQNYSGAIGLSAACGYLKKIGMANIEEHEKKLIAGMEKRASELKNIAVYGNFRDKKSAVFTFNINGVTAHQVTLMLDRMRRICTRSGVFCAQPAMEFLGAGNGAVRASLYIYNTLEELELFFTAVEEIAKTLI